MTHSQLWFKKIFFGGGCLDVMWCTFTFMAVKGICRIKEDNTSRISKKNIYLDIPNVVWYDIV